MSTFKNLFFLYERSRNENNRRNRTFNYKSRRVTRRRCSENDEKLSIERELQKNAICDDGAEEMLSPLVVEHFLSDSLAHCM